MELYSRFVSEHRNVRLFETVSIRFFLSRWDGTPFFSSFDWEREPQGRHGRVQTRIHPGQSAFLKGDDRSIRKGGSAVLEGGTEPSTKVILKLSLEPFIT